MPIRLRPIHLLAALAVTSLATGCGWTVVVQQGDGGEGGTTPGTGGADPVVTSSVTTGGSGGIGATGGGGLTTGPGGGGSGGCMQEIVPTTPVYGPLDVVFVTDNGFNMVDPLQALENAINPSFAQVLDGLGLDYRVVVLGDHGPGGQQLCIGPPLSAGSNCNGAPLEVVNRFYHYDLPVQTSAGLCSMLSTLYGTVPDQQGAHPGGWAPLLRPEAQHGLVAFTRSGTSCQHDGVNYFDFGQVMQGQTVALDWDAALLGLAPAIFGTTADRRYVFHSLVGLAEKSPDPFAPYLPSEPVVATNCAGAFGAGTGYQWLSKGTEGLRMPSCPHQGMPTMLSTLANEMAASVKSACARQLPSGYDPSTLSVKYTPSSGPEQLWFPVPGASACGAGDAFYVDATTEELRFCPEACALVVADGAIEVMGDCIALP
jgi:hypothetical protein